MDKEEAQTPVVSLISRGAWCTFLDSATQDLRITLRFNCVEKRYRTDAATELKSCKRI